MVSAPAVQSGQLHRYNQKLVAFEHLASSTQTSKHILLWVGGLGDGLHTVSYPARLAQKLPLEWSVAQVMIRSSNNGWGTGSLERDAKDLAQCVNYFRKNKPDGSKIVCMGHSTGCQDVMEYLTGKGYAERAVIDGAILQAPVSDREAMKESMDEEAMDKILKTSHDWIESGRGNDVLPESVDGKFFGKASTVTAYRWHSLLSSGGDDDYFSSDLSDEKLKKTFGAIKKESPLLILYSGADEYAPSSVDLNALTQKWMEFVKEEGGIVDEENGGIIPGAHHNLEEDGDEVLNDLCGRVCSFLSKIERGFSKAGANL
jgi:alpha-beta hydrolase superfamily lysophospholipase